MIRQHEFNRTKPKSEVIFRTPNGADKARDWAMSCEYHISPCIELWRGASEPYSKAVVPELCCGHWSRGISLTAGANTAVACRQLISWSVKSLLSRIPKFHYHVHKCLSRIFKLVNKILAHKITTHLRVIHSYTCYFYYYSIV
jgi:hypothetical protein